MPSSFFSISAIRFAISGIDCKIAPLLHFHIHQRLGIGLHARGELGQRLARLLHDRKDLERRDEPVARRIVVQENDVARLFSAEIVAALDHFFHDIPVADGGPDAACRLPCCMASSSPRLLMTVATSVFCLSLPCFIIWRAQMAMTASPSIDRAVFIAKDHPVRVAVKGDADLGLVRDHGAGDDLGMERAAALVDVHAVRLVIEGDDVGAELGQDARADLVCRAVGGIHDNAQSRKVHAARDR